MNETWKLASSKKIDWIDDLDSVAPVDIAANLAMSVEEWESVGASFREIDDGDGEHPLFAVGKVHESRTESHSLPAFGIMIYEDGQAYLLTKSDHEDRNQLLQDTLRTFLEAGIVRDPQNVLSTESDVILAGKPVEGETRASKRNDRDRARARTPRQAGSQNQIPSLSRQRRVAKVLFKAWCRQPHNNGRVRVSFTGFLLADVKGGAAEAASSIDEPVTWRVSLGAGRRYTVTMTSSSKAQVGRRSKPRSGSRTQTS